MRYDHQDRQLVLKRSVSLLGYWNCARYFEEISEQIRRDLQFKEPLQAEHDEVAREIGSCVSVGVHIRRSQYDRKLSMEYYRDGLTRFRKLLDGPRFYVFSDEPDWWSVNAPKSPDIQIMKLNGRTAIEDFRLLSGCRHFLIANSSFSWWAAWLSAGKGKKVIAPAGEIWDNNKDILPESWMGVPVGPDGQVKRAKAAGAEH